MYVSKRTLTPARVHADFPIWNGSLAGIQIQSEHINSEREF